MMSDLVVSVVAASSIVVAIVSLMVFSIFSFNAGLHSVVGLTLRNMPWL